MNSTKFIIVAIAIVIGLALTPVVGQQTGVLTEEPGCAMGEPRRLTATQTTFLNGQVVCSTSPVATTTSVTSPAYPTTPGGRFNSLYAGTASARTTTAPAGTLIGAGSIITLVPLIYIVGILLVPVGMLGKKFMNMRM